MKKTLSIILLTFSVSLNAQINIHAPMDSLLNAFGDKEVNTGLKGLLANELKVICAMQTDGDYKNIKLRISDLPKDCLRFIDSLDYCMIGKDSLFIGVYSRNYAYQSRNNYRFGLDSLTGSDTVFNCKVNYDMRMKPVIDDYSSFMEREFDCSVIDKELGDMMKTRRVTIIKNYR